MELILYTVFSIFVSIVGGFISTFNDLEKDIPKLGALNKPTQLTDLHDNNWCQMRAIFLRIHIYMEYERLKKWLGPMSICVGIVSILFIFFGVVLANIKPAMTIWGIENDVLGKGMMYIGPTLLYLYTFYFRLSAFLLMREEKAVSSLS